MTVDIHDIETRLWAAADELRANSKLKSSEYLVQDFRPNRRITVACEAPESEGG